MVSKNAINGEEKEKKTYRGWQEEKETVVGVGRDVRVGESVFVTCVLCYYLLYTLNREIASYIKVVTKDLALHEVQTTVQ